MMCKDKKYIIIIIGYSGAGKSTLAKILGKYFCCDVLSFSYIGQALANKEVKDMRLEEINNYIYNCILASVSRNKIIVVDGLVFAEIVYRLSCEGYMLTILFLHTSYDERIQRMMRRERCLREEAIQLERIKTEEKLKFGLSSVIQNAEIELDGSKEIERIAEDAISYIEEKLRNE